MTAWKLVPVKPTEGMVRAHYNMSPKYESWDDSCRRQYATILAAAPKPDEAVVERMARAMLAFMNDPDDNHTLDGWVENLIEWPERECFILAAAALAAMQENGDE